MASRATPQSSERLFQRHQELLGLYWASRRSCSVSSDPSSLVARTDQHVSPNDLAVLQRNFQFIRNDESDAKEGEKDWEVRMSVRYYRQLFREYAVADLSRYQEGQIGLRWRTEREVVTGKGHFSCGTKECEAKTELHSYEVLFAYTEQGERHRCFVKVRACRPCAAKLFYKKLMDRKSPGKKDKRARKRRRLAAEEGDEGQRLCAPINADQKAAWGATAKFNTAKKRDHEFGDLLS